uniref:POM121-like protein 1 n=1 Tax=Phocoena sinus TaxID=42100 RepID=A0A8C9BDP6_PHOSS
MHSLWGSLSPSSGETIGRNCVPNYSTEKTVLRALGESGQGMAKQEEVPTVTGRNEDQRSGPNDTGDARSAFRPLGSSFFVPRPGPLQRDLHAKWAEDRSTRKQQTSCLSSCPQRNAITSSYSSTRGFPPVDRRRGPAIPHGLSQKSAKKGSKEGPPSPSATPVVSQRKSQPDKDAEATRGQKGPWRNGSHTSDSPRPRKRRIPLLPHRRGDPLKLPPAPEPGFRVTAEDLDSEKEAAFRRINSALRGETYVIGDLSSSSQQRKRKSPVFASAPGTPASGGPAQASSGCSSPTNSTVGTHASTQLGLGSRASALDLSCMFAALSVTTGKRGPRSTTHSNGGSVGLYSRGPPHQSHPMVTTGPSPKKKPRFGGTTASILGHIPMGAPRQGPPTSSGGRSPCPAKADFRGVSVPVSTPISLSSAVGTARYSLALRAPSSPAQGLAGQKTTGPSTKSFSSRSRFITLGFKRRKLA